MKNIMYIAPSLPVGGAEKFLIFLVNSLSKTATIQTVVSLSDNNILAKEIDPSIEMVSIPRKSKLSLDSLRSLRHLIDQKKPDIIFCLNFFSYFFLRIATLNLKLKPTIYISYHSTVHLTRKEDLLHKVYISMLRKNDVVVMVSQKQADYTAQHYKLNKNQVITILNGVNTDFWKLPGESFDKALLLQQYSIPAGSKVIILVAAFRAEKNHLGAVRALAKMHAAYNNKAYLLFVGHGLLMDEVKKKVSEAKMDEYIKFAGLQSDLRPFYWSSDLFTLTSTNVETFSVAALEAMSCGLPAVLTDIGGASEMIDPKINGLLTDTSDESIAAAWNKALSGSYSNETIHRYIDTNFGAEKMTTNYQKMMGI